MSWLGGTGLYPTTDLSTAVTDPVLNAITGQPTDAQVAAITDQTQLDLVQAMGLLNPDGTLNPNGMIGDFSVSELYSMGYSTSDILTMAQQQASAGASIVSTVAGPTAQQTIANKGVLGSILASPGAQNFAGTGFSLSTLFAGTAGIIVLIAVAVILFELKR